MFVVWLKGFYEWKILWDWGMSMSWFFGDLFLFVNNKREIYGCVKCLKKIDFWVLVIGYSLFWNIIRNERFKE